jgi:hypothetical protein
MALHEKQLGQRRDGDTDTHSIYSPAANVVGIVKTIVIANTTGSDATVSVFIDDDGTTYDQSTALMYEVSIAANSTTRQGI